jgi:hypothetical protein
MAFKPSKEDVDRGLSITAIAGIVTILVGASTLLVSKSEFVAHTIAEETENLDIRNDVSKEIQGFAKVMETFMVGNKKDFSMWARGNYSILNESVTEEIRVLEDIDNKTEDQKARLRRLKGSLERINRAAERYE